MKAHRIIGVVCLILAVLLIATALLGGSLSGSDSKLGREFSAAAEREARIDAHKKAAEKTAPNSIKKADAAVSAAQACEADSESALKKLRELNESYQNGSIGDKLTDVIIASSRIIADSAASATDIAEAMEDQVLAQEILSALTQIASINEEMSVTVDEKVLALFVSETNSAYKSVSGAESKLTTAFSGIGDVYSGAGMSYSAPSFEPFVKRAPTTFEDAISYAEALCVQASSLSDLAATAAAQAIEAQTTATYIAQADSAAFRDVLLLLVGRDSIGFMLTGVILLMIGIIALFFCHPFLRAWKHTPVFSTFIAALIMIVIQTYSLGFRFSTYGEWGDFWLSNMLNVLRSNSSVGMIALGMTFVIITGGIDLAVGSTLAGVATVVMVLLDTSAHGVLVNAGITGLTNFIIAIVAGILTGIGIGALTGLGITKGRIPPFIITLGVMNIVRSVAQYFTKSYKTEVPKAFQVIANKEIIGGQMLLPIIYWLILAVIMHVISRHTAFGRHIYAVGSNERTSRLSGINVNRVKMKVYMLMGFIVSIAAITSVARLRGVDVASAGSGYEMNAIAAVVVGGTSMAGGRGSIIGTVLGVLIIGIMNNLLVLLHIDAFLSNAFTGAIIIFAVLLQRKEKA